MNKQTMRMVPSELGMCCHRELPCLGNVSRLLPSLSGKVGKQPFLPPRHDSCLFLSGCHKQSWIWCQNQPCL